MSGRYIVRDLLAKISRELQGIENAQKEAQLLVQHYLQKDSLWLITNQTAQIEVCEDLFALVARRKAHEPLEYITNRVSFFSKEFFIDKGALIPRPETELLIEEVMQRINKNTNAHFVEVGVGSGIISIVLALHFTDAKFIAVDISADALEIAKKNIEIYNLQNRIELRQGSLLDVVDEHIDYLVSNPPYVAQDAKLEQNLSFEPQNALFGGVVGDEIIKELLDAVLKRKIKFFSCEMGYDQKDKIQNYMNDKEYLSLDFYKDYSGFDRGFTLRLG